MERNGEIEIKVNGETKTVAGRPYGGRAAGALPDSQDHRHRRAQQKVIDRAKYGDAAVGAATNSNSCASSAADSLESTKNTGRQQHDG